MKANELRIGNLVHCPAIGDTYTDRNPHYGFCVFPVNQIRDGELIRIDIGHGASQIVDLGTNEAEPIHLTEEWLLKFGFKRYDIYRCGIDEKLVIDGSSDAFGFFAEDEVSGFIYDRQIKYVHQLQNLYFALTGEELKIK